MINSNEQLGKVLKLKLLIKVAILGAAIAIGAFFAHVVTGYSLVISLGIGSLLVHLTVMTNTVIEALTIEKKLADTSIKFVKDFEELKKAVEEKEIDE